MIPDELQDQAALYALDALSPEETDAFESILRGNVELQEMVRGMREASTAIGHSVPSRLPPPGLKQRILREVTLEKQRGAPRTSAQTTYSYLPWAIAALFLVFCGILALDRAHLKRELAQLEAVDPLSQTTLVTLSPPTGESSAAQATVVWQSDRQSGVIAINHLSPPGKGRDYQLWTVDAQHKDPISSGLIHVDASGVARINFKPDQNAAQVKAFAISLEREGGVPKREGPIVLIGGA